MKQTRPAANTTMPQAGFSCGLVAMTGAQGYVGAEIARQLATHGYALRVLTRTSTDLQSIPGAEQVVGDLADAESVKRLLDGAQMAVHAGGVVRAQDPAAFRLNVEAAANLADATGASSVIRLVIVSSGGVFGQPGGTVYEDSPHRPSTPYELSKSQAETLLTPLVDAGVARVLRPTVVFGGSNPTNALLRVARRIQGRQRVPIGVSANMNYVPVTDVAHSVFRALTDPIAPGVVNINCPVTMEELVRRLSESVGIAPRIVRIPAIKALRQVSQRIPPVRRLAGGSLSSLSDSTRIETRYPEWRFAGCNAETILSAGLDAMIADYRERGLL